MPSHISFKNSFFMLLGGLVIAVGMVFLLNYLFSGPKLGPHYDFLLSYHKPQAVSREILIIESDEMTDGSELFNVLMTLTEMGAASFIMTGSLSPSSSPVTLTETQIRRRFSEEYGLVGSNIRNLFEGIRMGSVPPLQAPSYVERLVELTELGRERLLSALIDRDEDFLRSVAVFGNYLEVEDEPYYDSDGKIRRIRPLDQNLSFEHPVYVNLKNRFIASHVESSDNGQIFWMRRADGSEFDIQLDKDGNIITAWNAAFRRVDISLFHEYKLADIDMRDTLAAANELGIFSQTLPELSPLFLGDHANVLRDDLLLSPDDNNRIAWITGRANYLKSIENFLNSTAENNLTELYESEIIAIDITYEAERNELIKMRDDMKRAFRMMREQYSTLNAIHSTLKNELHFSYCIMGPEASSLYSALIANTVITGSHIKSAYDRAIITGSVIACALVLILIFLLSPFFLFITGIILSVISACAFSFIFINYSYWIDPAVVLLASLCGTLFLFYFKCAYLSRRARNFRFAYGAAMSDTALANLIKIGKPAPSQICTAYAAIIAIKDVNLLGKEETEKQQDSGKLRKAFVSSVKKVIFSSGAVIVGFEGDTILACFGSPLDPNPSLAICGEADDGTPIRSYSPVDKACALVRGLLDYEKFSWRFGIDAGECTFYWSAETGYSVNGRPAIKARVLVSKTSRFKVRALVTETIKNKIDMNTVMRDAHRDDNETFYELKSTGF